MALILQDVGRLGLEHTNPSKEAQASVLRGFLQKRLLSKRSILVVCEHCEKGFSAEIVRE